METRSVTPQVGILSPTLANFTLNGLENAILNSIREKYRVIGSGIRGNQLKRYIPKIYEKGEVKGQIIQLQLCIVRFVDIFLVITRSKRMIIECVKPAIEKFLKVRGLTLASDKKQVISVRNSDKINFLGYTFQYIEKFKPKYKLFRDRIGKEGIACYPQKEEFKSIRDKVKTTIKKALNLTAYELIAKLNPMIRDWCSYFNLSQSYIARDSLYTYLFRLLSNWAQHKHPRWGKKRIACQYFLGPKKLGMLNNDKRLEYLDYNYEYKPPK